MKSIRTRILVPSLILTAGALGLAALSIEGAVRRDLQGSLDRRLWVLVQGVAAGVESNTKGDPTFELELGDIPELKEPSSEAFYIVFEPGRGVIASSPGALSEEVLLAEPQEKLYATKEVRDMRFRVCSLSVIPEPSDDPGDRGAWSPGNLEQRPVLVTVGISTGALEASIAALRLRMASTFGSLFAILVFGPTWLVSRALRRLGRLSSQAQTIAPDTPNLRLEESTADQEVRPLVIALNQALDRLATAYERQKRFTADAAHELRAPLAAVRAQCEVALRKPRPSEELREALEAVHRTTLRLGDLVEQLLALTRLQGVAAFSADRADLAQASREAVRLHEAPALAKGVSLILEVPPDLAVLGSETLLTECIANLVENAVRYTSSGGEVRVAVRALPTPAVTVRDNGIGVPAAHRERIFDRFYRIDSSRARAEGGSGLGLAIAREIARLHGGEIALAAPEEGGSVFELRLPAAGHGLTPPSPAREESA